jgi:hypothetical protein
MIPKVPVEITIKNEVPAWIFSPATSFLTIISRYTKGNHIYGGFSCHRKRFPGDSLNKIGSSKFPWEYLLETIFSVKIFLREPYL